MGRPYAYLRKSVIHRDQRTISPETQEREVRALAARYGDNGDRLHLLADWDVSGRRRAKRPGYGELVDAIGSGACSAIYSYSLSRLSRSVRDLADLFDLCRDRKVPIRIVADSIDTSTASGILTANMLAAVAQFESDIASERMTGMYATKRANGEPILTRKPYGEKPGQDAAAVLAAYDETGTYSGAARLLNERGIAPASAKPRRMVRKDGTEVERAAWWSSSVRVVVQRLRPELATAPGRKGQRSGGFMLAKLLTCGTCGSTLTGSRLPSGRNGGRYTRYACRFAESSPHPRVSIAESKLLPWIMEEAARLEVPGDQLTRSEDDAVERARLDAKRARILDAFMDGTIDKAERDRRLGAVADALARMERSAVVVDIPALDWSKPPEAVNAVLRALWERIELGPDLRPVRAEWIIPEWRST